MSIYLSSRKLKPFEIFSVKLAKNNIFQNKAGSLSTNTGCDVIAGTEVIFTHIVYYNFVLRAEASCVLHAKKCALAMLYTVLSANQKQKII